MRYELIHVGYTRKAVGFDGSMRIELEEQYIDDALKAEALFIEYGFEIIPFFPKSLTDDRFFVVKFDDLNSKEEVTKIAGKNIYLRKSEVHASNETETIDLPELDGLIGINLYDHELGLIGEIKAVESFPQQQMLLVDFQSKEIMIPLHTDLVIDFVPDERLTLALPEGLLSL